MRHLHLAMLGSLIAAPAFAQPIIIPLQRQSEPQTPGPMASAPPVAPPQAAPSIPDTGIARGPDAAQQEEAYQPADRPATPETPAAPQ